MGCDIHSYVEVYREGRWQRADDQFEPPAEWGPEGDGPFAIRNYGVFGFLADVRNYSHSPVIAEPRGLPDDVAMTDEQREEWEDGWYHSASWLTVAELLAYDYDQVFWDRRIEREVLPGHWNGAALAEEGEGERLPLRAFLGTWFFEQVERLRSLGDPEWTRVVFWFDS